MYQRTAIWRSHEGWVPWAVATVTALTFMTGCESVTGLEPAVWRTPGLEAAGILVPEPQLTFVRFDGGLFAGADTVGSFWAVKGKDREIIIRYASSSPGKPGDKFLRFKVSKDALFRRPDGTEFAKGDSALITVHVDAAERFLFRFEPSGLTFSANKPAELQLWYDLANPDLNDDGQVDAEDDAFEQTLTLWKQEHPGGPFTPTEVLEFNTIKDQIKGAIPDFSGFAVAS